MIALITDAVNDVLAIFMGSGKRGFTGGRSNARSEKLRRTV